MPDYLTGGCCCGGVRYRLEAPFRDVLGCHCSQCRKTSGHFVAMTSVPDTQFTLESGETLTWYKSSESARRGFCARCGGNLFFKPVDESRISVAAGTIDGDTGLRMTRHLYPEMHGDYYELNES